MAGISAMLSDVVRLFFPHHCGGCGTDIIERSQFLCLKCQSDLPHTGYEKIAYNPVEKIFAGRVPVVAASSQFYFSKGHLIQHLIHQLKYKGNTDAGEYLGTEMGRALLASNRFCNLDVIVPLPLFADKEYKRGYNQAEVICKGMALMMQLPVQRNNVVRIRYTDSQTKKHRTERWQNVENSFAVKNKTALAGKSILLVDDVITTGATLEACSQAVLAIEGTRLSIVTLAIASS